MCFCCVILYPPGLAGGRQCSGRVCKHSRASCAKVWVEGHGYPGTLTVMVSDDGIGGADPDGAGLTGLADRVHGVDGRFSVESPVGGPTINAAELPCG